MTRQWRLVSRNHWTQVSISRHHRHEPFNIAVRNGQAGATIAKILEELKPEAVYFTEQDGHRGATLVVNVERPSQIPVPAEPWFLSFNADCKFRVVMSPEELEQVGLEELVKRWA
jgi:hypothetical protein